MKNLALCLHDLRLSNGPAIQPMVESLRQGFNSRSITCHLVVDVDPSTEAATVRYLRTEVEAGRLEVVFHGIAHRCPKGTARWMAWYHKYQAEFLGAFFDRNLNRKRFEDLGQCLNTRLGFCPPCWIASGTGQAFMESLHPLFVEKIFFLHREGKRFFSPVISLGSAASGELFLLKLLAGVMGKLSFIFRLQRIRLVAHVADLDIPKSMECLRRQHEWLRSQGYVSVLQKNLC